MKAESKSSPQEPPMYLMLLLICIGTIGGVLYSPALPAITEHFKITSDRSELTMTCYLIGYALGQLPFGPISNAFGRKSAIKLGLFVAAIGALVGALSGYTSYFWLLVVSRFVFALGASVGLQVIFTMVGDFYKPPKSAQVASYLTLAFAIGPSIGITIGGFLTQYLTWESCFYFLFVYCLVLIYLTKKLPETALKKDNHAIKIPNICKEYSSKFKCKKILSGSILIGCVVSFSYIFATIAPFIGIEVLGLTPSQYGALNLIPSLGIILGSLCSAYLSKYYHSLTLIKLALVLVFFGAIPLFGLFIFNLVNVYTLFIPFTIALIGQPIIEANVLTLSMHSNENKASTSAIINFINLSVCAFFVVFISFPDTVEPIVMPSVFLALAILALFLYRIYSRQSNEKKS